MWLSVSVFFYNYVVKCCIRVLCNLFWFLHLFWDHHPNFESYTRTMCTYGSRAYNKVNSWGNEEKTFVVFHFHLSLTRVLAHLFIQSHFSLNLTRLPLQLHTIQQHQRVSEEAVRQAGRSTTPHQIHSQHSFVLPQHNHSFHSLAISICNFLIHWFI